MRTLLPIFIVLLTLGTGELKAEKPNILFISMDDLNDWIGCMGGNQQSITPNLDRLAKSGVLFTNAHCPGAACNPSRTAIMTGLSPHTSGLYDNGQKMREILPDAELLPQHFRNNGYRASGSGKILHYFIDARSWDEYFPKKEAEDPFPRTLYPDQRPVNLPRGGPWQYVETDWAALDATDEEYGGDYLVSNYVGEQLAKEHDQPFFLACGIYRPHEPWFVPKKYYEPFPLEDIQLPPGYKEDDLDDLPPSGKKRGPNRYFAHIQEHDQWKKGIQGYLASIHFADAMLGRVLDALESGPNRDNTIVVLWSDHGWHLGEKQHWQKFTAWRAVTRIPLIVRVPEKAAPGLPAGTRAGAVCNQPVNLLSLFPTLTELAGIAPKKDNDGPSIVPLLKNPEADWNHVSLTHLGEGGSYGLSAKDWRYIHYKNGDEELYDIAKDPYEWTNLAANPEFSGKLTELRALGPTKFAPKKEASISAMTSLKWRPASKRKVPPSKPDGGTFQVLFLNKRKETVELSWIDRKGKPKSYGLITAGKKKSQQTRPGAIWKISKPETGETLGHFQVGDRKAKAVIPALPKSVSGKVTTPPADLKLDPFYKKYLAVGGYPIISSGQVSDYALYEVRHLIETMLAKRPDILEALVETDSRFTVMAHDEFTTDIPEHSHLGKGKGKHSSDWWDRRARGLGGSATDPVASCGEENLLCFPGDPYAKENILIHEFAHTIHLRGLNHIDPKFDDRVKKTYDEAMAAGLWEGKYAASNHHEYFAESVQSWFNNNREDDHDHNHVNTREELKTYDPGISEILREIFGDTKFEYVRPPERKQQAHLKGYDYSKSPTFNWPKHLKILDPATN